MATFKVCLDAGHYGNYNRSPKNANYWESVQMLKLTKYQKEYLEEYKDVEVVLTRKGTEDIALYTRGAMAKGCNLFISNHSNACDIESVDYPVVYGAWDNKGNPKDFGLKLAKVIETKMNTKQAGKTATRVNESGSGEYYGVLRGARAVGLTYYYIIEHSFHTNTNATNWLLNEGNLKALAKAEVECIANYFGLVKKNGTTSIPSVSNPNFTSYTVKINTNELNVRAGAGISYKVVTTVKRNEVYTIVAESNGWGKLKSGIGYICLDYCIKQGEVSTPVVTIKEGSKVKIIGSTYATGGNIPSWAKNSVFTVTQLKSDRALLDGYTGGFCSWVYLKDLKLV